MKHPCIILHEAATRGCGMPIYGDTPGMCVITGERTTGLPVTKALRKTFTDYDLLEEGDIVGNRALFCMDEASVLLQERKGKDKPQRMRNYSHFVVGGEWFPLAKNEYDIMLRLLIDERCELAVIAESGQKHLIYKARPGWWCVEGVNVLPDRDAFLNLHRHIRALAEMGCTQKDIATGELPKVASKWHIAQLRAWESHVQALKPHLRTALFRIAIKFWRHDYEG